MTPERVSPLSDVVGNREVAELLGTTRKHVPMLAARRASNGFPEPLKVLACGPLYSAREIRAWGQAHGMPKPLTD